MKIRILVPALLVVSSLAYAGSDEYSGKDMKQVAPAPSESINWTGFYVGGFGGYTFSSVKTDLRLGGGYDTFTTGQTAIQDAAPRDLDNNGGEAGGLLGYNYQLNHWVFGLEGSGAYLWARQSDIVPTLIPPRDPQDIYKLSSSFKTHYVATFGPRVGYAVGRWLPFVTGGLAVGDLDYKQHLENYGVRQGGFTFAQDARENDNNVGWMTGGGLEYALTNHWHLRGQYQFIDLGDVRTNSAGVGTLGTPADFTGTHRARLHEHNASMALIYEF